LRDEDIKNLPMRRIWTLLDNIPGIWNKFWGGEKKDSPPQEVLTKNKLNQMAKRFGEKLPKKGL